MIVRASREHWSPVTPSVRRIVRHPAAALFSFVLLSVAIGALAAAHTLVERTVVHPVDLDPIDRYIAVRNDAPGIDVRSTDISPAEAEDLMARTDVFSAIAAYLVKDFNLSAGGTLVRARGAATMGEFFDLFAARAYLGRVYRADSNPAGSLVAVLSYGFWKEISGDSSIVGTTLILDGRSYEVIGILEPTFRPPQPAQIFVPFEMLPKYRREQWRGWGSMNVVARLRDPVDLAAARSALADETRQWHSRFPIVYDQAKTQHHLIATPFAVHLAGAARPLLITLFGGTVLLFAIACASVAGLGLARVVRRGPEVAIRRALGASTPQILREYILEPVIICLASGIVGAWIGAQLLAMFGPELRPTNAGLGIATPLAVAALPVVTAVMVALGVIAAPIAVLLSRSPIALRRDIDAVRVSPGRSHERALSAITTSQIFVAVVLMTGAITATARALQLLRIDPGFREMSAVTFRVAPPPDRYRPPQAAAFYSTLLTEIATRPGVTAVGTVSELPFGGDTPMGGHFEIDGIPQRADAPEQHSEIRLVSPDYFRAIGLPLLRGRGFSTADGPAAPPVVVINEVLARRFFAGHDPIGYYLATGVRALIVGVVSNNKQSTLGENDHAVVYHPAAQVPWVQPTWFVVSANSGPSGLVGAIRRAVAALDPQLIVYDVAELRDWVDRSRAPERAYQRVLIGYATLSIGLAVVAIYGLFMYVVQRRRREFGIRLALGATTRGVRWLVLRWAARLAVLGGLAGVVCAAGMGTLLPNVAPWLDRWFLLAVAAACSALIVPTAMAAAYTAAHQASRIDPSRSLRMDSN